MASDDGPLAPMRFYEALVWPEVEQQERAFRRRDVIFVVCGILAMMLLAVGATLTPEGIPKAVTIGALGPIGVNLGMCFQRILDRRAGYAQLRELHEHAQFTLSYHAEHEDDEP